MRSVATTASIPNFYLHAAASGRASQAISTSVPDLRENVLAYVLAEGKHKFVVGHVRCRPQLTEAFRRDWHFITVLRDPVERWISNYVYDRYKTTDWAATELPIEEYVDSETGRLSGMTYLLYFSNAPADPSISDCERYIDEAEANLQTFDLVGRTDNLTQFAAAFGDVFGKPLVMGMKNRTPNQQVKVEIRGDAALMERIREVCRPDIELYSRLSDTLI